MTGSRQRRGVAMAVCALAMLVVPAVVEVWVRARWDEQKGAPGFYVSLPWEVWNLGVPGYNTRQELDLLRRVGPSHAPDLVIVGFYANDLAGNEVRPAPSWSRRVGSAARCSDTCIPTSSIDGSI